MADVALRLLVIQFLIAAIFWTGSAPLTHFRWNRGPRWARVELTRLVLPLLMVSAGLLFFSAPLAPLWQSPLELEGFRGIPATGSRWAFLGLNFAVLAAVLAATGGSWRSPFSSLLAALPLFTWAVGAPAPEVWGAWILAALTAVATGRPSHHHEPESVGFPEDGDLERSRSRWWTVVACVLTLAAATWMGGRLSP